MRRFSGFFKFERKHMHIYTIQECLEALLKFQEDRKEVPARSQYNVWCVGKEIPSGNALLRVLSPERKSWDEVLRYLDLTSEHVRKQKRRKQSSFLIENCKTALRECSKEFQHTPQQIQYHEWQKRQSLPYPSAQTVVRLGDPGYPESKSWYTALNNLGFDISSIPRQMKTRQGVFRTKEELIVELFSCYQELSEVPSSYLYDQWVKERVEMGDNPPTQTTLRRRLDPEDKKWHQVLTNAGLDPKLMSQKSRNQRIREQTDRCILTLRNFADYFKGVAPLNLYLRWSMLDSDRASVGCILNRIGGEHRSWNHALQQAGLDECEQITSNEALERNGTLPAISTKKECIEALKRYEEEFGYTPSVSSYRYWSAHHKVKVTEGEILYRLSPESWNWSTALERAFR
jgi:hypothetical protein